MPELTVFISHRSTDVELAKALIELIEKALKLPARQIRCTSVDGYRLPVGADTDEQLRREVFESRVFLGIITPTSIASAYVLFELGARWGAKKHLAPLLARGADAVALGGPLAGINALRIDQRNQVVQLAEDIAEYLTLDLEPAASYQSAIDKVVQEAMRPAAVVSSTDPPEPDQQPDLEDIEVKLLAMVAHGVADPERIAAQANLKLEKANYYLQRLSNAALIHDQGILGDKWYKVLQKGRAFLVERSLL